MIRYDLVKFGVSETKRANIKQSYTILVDFVIKNNGKKLNESEIFQFLKEERFFTGFKVEENVKREMSLINNLGIGKTTYYKELEKYLIEKNQVSENWENDEYENKFWGLTSIDYSFFQLLLKQKFNNGNKVGNCFYHIVNFLNNKEKITEDILLTIENKERIRNCIKNKDIISIKNILVPKSGSKNPEIKKMNDNLVNLFVEGKMEEKNNIEEIISLIINIYEKNGKVSVGIDSLIFNETFSHAKMEKLIRGKKFENWVAEKINEGYVNFEKRVFNRIIQGSWDSYRHLIKSHLIALDKIFIYEVLEKDKKEKFSINPLYKDFIEKILINGSQGKLNFENEKFYDVNELSSILGVDSLVFLPQKISDIEKKIFDNYYEKKQLIKLLEEIKESYENNKIFPDQSKIYKIIRNHPHMKGKVDYPTFFEFLVGMIFLTKKNIEIIKINKEEKDIIKRSFRTKLDSNLCPVRFAPGGKADIMIKNQINFINIEPTTQIKNQVKMEFDSSLQHLINDLLVESKLNNKIKNAISIIVAPKIEDRLIFAFKGINKQIESKMKIVIFDCDSLIEMLKSNENIYDFCCKHEIEPSRLVKTI